MYALNSGALRRRAGHTAAMYRGAAISAEGMTILEAEFEETGTFGQRLIAQPIESFQEPPEKPGLLFATRLHFGESRAKISGRQGQPPSLRPPKPMTPRLQTLDGILDAALPGEPFERGIVIPHGWLLGTGCASLAEPFARVLLVNARSRTMAEPRKVHGRVRARFALGRTRRSSYCSRSSCR